MGRSNRRRVVRKDGSVTYVADRPPAPEWLKVKRVGGMWEGTCLVCQKTYQDSVKLLVESRLILCRRNHFQYQRPRVTPK